MTEQRRDEERSTQDQELHVNPETVKDLGPQEHDESEVRGGVTGKCVNSGADYC